MVNLKKIQEVEFDYDKLAEAIVKAEKKAKNEENKIDGPSWFLKLILILIFGSIALFCLIGLIVIPSLVKNGAIYIQGALGKITLSILVIIILGYAIFAAVLSVEIYTIKDKQYILNYFGAITGLLALIISFIALYRGI